MSTGPSSIPLTGADVPDAAGFAALAGTVPVRPVVRRLLADGETPVGLYRKLAAGRPGTFLLESAEHGRAWSRYSFVGVRSVATLTERDGAATWLGQPPPGVADVTGLDPLAALRVVAEALRSPRVPGLPPLTGGLVGYLGYDIVRRLERLPQTAPDELALAELAMMLTTDLAVLDHYDGSVLLIANALGDEPYAGCVARLDSMADALAAPAASTVGTLAAADPPAYTGRTERADYLAGVETIREHIRAGDAFQVVLSQRFEMATAADPLDIYRVLRASNPSPYMYLLRFEGLDIVGSSPEALVRVTDGRALMRPIAGTRPRGDSPAEDARLAGELLADPKERSEHVMLVDLARNDLGRVCAPGSVDVIDFLAVERYSHVMHLVSTVVGEVRDGLSPYDVLAACFPAGTLSGAPKPRAMEIIESLEPARRGLYGGAVGYLDFGGDLDTAIAIRTALLRDGVAYVQAGAGIVADSDPVTEDAESRNKAAAVLRAVAMAEKIARSG
ncbi:MAG: anthranilate synthase component I [Frankiaceae bacterium]